MSNILGRAAVRAGLFASLALLGAQAAQAQNVGSWVKSELQDDETGDTIDGDVQVSKTAGTGVATTLGGGDTRALTDFGVNKVRASGSSAYGQSAASVWLDSYTVGGAAGTMVDFSFTVSVDGLVNVPGDDHSWNYKLIALRGDGWTATGRMDFDDWPANTPRNYYHTGDSFDRVFLNRVRPDGGFTQLDARDFEGVNNYAANGGEVGAFQTNGFWDESSGTFIRTLINGNNLIEQHYGPLAFRQRTNNGPWSQPVPYQQNPSLLTLRNNLIAGYALIGTAELCFGQDNECANQSIPGTDLTLSFSMLAGSTFSLAGYMFADDVYNGTIDFYNTAKLTGISVSQGGSLNAASGTLVDLGNGQYGYEAVLAAAVPEPSAWALLILGFGLTGGAMRRRTRSAVQARAALRFG